MTKRSYFGESTSPNGLTAYGESPSLRVGQSKSSATELLLENVILFAEIVDHRILVATNPAGQGGDEDLPRLDHGCHPSIVAR